MKLTDIIDDSYDAEMAAETSEEISDLVRKGLDRFEKAFKSKFVEIVRTRGKNAGVSHIPLESRAYSVDKKCDEFLRDQIKKKKKVREDYYNMFPSSRPSSESADEEGTQMPPLGMVSSLVFTSGLKVLFTGLKKSERKDVCDIFGINAEEMIKIFDHFNEIRNKCSHDRGQYYHSEFAFCLTKFTGPSDLKILRKGEIETLNLKNNLFGTITLLGYMLSNVQYRYMSFSSGKWIQEMKERLSDLPQEVLTEMGFPNGWTNHHIWQKSKRKTIQGIGVLHNSSLQVLEEMYNDLDSDQKREIEKRTQFISSNLINKGWDTFGSEMDNLEWTARASVMRSVLGFEDDGYGFPMEELDIAKALANGSSNANDLLNALNDFYAGRMFNDSVMIFIPKDTPDKVILQKIVRWMKFDQKRRSSDYHNSLLMKADIVRKGGPIISITNIFPAFSAPFFYEVIDEQIHNFGGYHGNFLSFLYKRKADYADKFPEWFKPENFEKLFDMCRHVLMTRIGENGVMKVTYSKISPWPKEIIVDLDRVNPNFKEEVEEGYKFRDPEKVGCEPYEVPFHYPFMLEIDVEDKLQEKTPARNPFASVDSVLRYTHRYYRSVIGKKFSDKISSFFNGEMGIDLYYNKLIPEGEGKFIATFDIEVFIGDIYDFKIESVIPIEVENVNGERHLNIRRMQLRCGRGADDLMKKLIKKIKQKGRRV